MASTPKVGLAAIIAAGLMVMLAPAAGATPQVTQIVSLTGTRVPESIAIDHKGNLYVSEPLSGQVVLVPHGSSHASTFVTLPGTVLGVRLDDEGDLYAAVLALDPTAIANAGIYEVPAGTRSARRIAAPPAGRTEFFLNGMAFDHRGNLYVSESHAGEIWRLAKSGGFSLWTSSALLLGTTGPGPCGLGHPAVPAGFGAIGANGLFFNGHGDMLVNNTDLGTVIRIPVNPDGSAGTPRVFAGPSCTLWGADGGAMDTQNNLYVAANSSNSIVRVDPLGHFQVFSASPLLHFPTDMAFGTGRGNRKVAYITNLALTSGLSNGGIVSMDIGVPGRPVP